MKWNEVDTEFVEAEKFKAINKWKWKNPYLAALLAFLHPLGMLYTSFIAFVVYLAAIAAVAFVGVVFFNGSKRPWPVGLALALAFTFYAYLETRFRNAAIEKWRYGLAGRGNENPLKLGLALKRPDAKRLQNLLSLFALILAIAASIFLGYLRWYS